MTETMTEKVRLFLDRLGKTPDEVADTFRRRGIKGVPAEARCCPIANAVKKHIGDGLTVTACQGHVSVWKTGDDEDPTARVMLADCDPCRQFIGNFDSNKYPDLIEESK